MSLSTCPKCGSIFDNHSRWGTKKFCSTSCANSRGVRSAETRRKISNSLKEFRCTEEGKALEYKISNTTKNKFSKSKILCECCGKVISKRNKYNKCQECYFTSGDFENVVGNYSRFIKTRVWCDYLNKSVLLHSGLELNYYKWLMMNNTIWSRPSYLSYRDDKGKLHKYFPDFYLPNEDKYIEVKGYFWNNDIDKMTWVLEQNNIDLIILMKKDIRAINDSIKARLQVL